VGDEHLELADYRRRVAALYQQVREEGGTGAGSHLARFRRGKDIMFRTHPQSPVPAAGRASFGGLAYWPYQAELRVVGSFTPDAEASAQAVPSSGGGTMGLRHIGQVAFRIEERLHRLGVYWFDEYAGGIFIPFRDATNGSETYEGGRYLWDSAKGADLGSDDDALMLDFNYAYHPSCVYDPHWSCPLAPPANRLGIPIRAGERLAGT